MREYMRIVRCNTPERRAARTMWRKVRDNMQAEKRRKKDAAKLAEASCQGPGIGKRAECREHCGRIQRGATISEARRYAGWRRRRRSTTTSGVEKIGRGGGWIGDAATN